MTSQDFRIRVNSTLLTYFKALKGRVHLTQGAALRWVAAAQNQSPERA